MLGKFFCHPQSHDYPQIVFNIPSKKRKAYRRYTVGFFSIFGVRSNIQQLYLYSSVAQSSISLCPKIHLIQCKLEPVISLYIREG